MTDLDDVDLYGDFDDADASASLEEEIDEEDASVPGDVVASGEDAPGAEPSQTGETGESVRERKPVVSRHVVKKHVAKTLEVAGADPAVRKLAASQLGVKNPDDVAAVATAILTADGKPVGLLAARDLASRSREEILFTLFGSSRSRSRGVWSVLRGLNLVSGGLPAHEVKAIRHLVDLLDGLSEGQRATIEASIGLVCD